MSTDLQVLSAVSGGGVVVGWLARHFKNGAKADSEVVVLLRQIAANTAGLPANMQELREGQTQIQVGIAKLEGR